VPLTVDEMERKFVGWGCENPENVSFGCAKVWVRSSRNADISYAKVL